MSEFKHSDDVQEKLSLLDRIINVFRNKKTEEFSYKDENELEPRYWPEVREFIDNLNTVIDSHTQADANAERVNERVVEYIVEQINEKGKIQDVEKRYSALRTLSDRVLTHHLNRLAGVKKATEYNTDFSDVVNLFKTKLDIRRENEVTDDQKRNKI